MQTRIDPHALEGAEERGTNEAEIRNVINAGFAVPAKHGPMGKARVYRFQQRRHGKYYEQKQVEVIFAMEKNDIIRQSMSFMENGRWNVQILYNDKTDLLYLRLDDRKQPVINKRVSDDIVLDVGEDERIVGIEILDASKNLNLESLLPVKYEAPSS